MPHDPYPTEERWEPPLDDSMARAGLARRLVLGILCSLAALFFAGVFLLVLYCTLFTDAFRKQHWINLLDWTFVMPAWAMAAAYWVIGEATSIFAVMSGLLAAECFLGHRPKIAAAIRDRTPKVLLAIFLGTAALLAVFLIAQAFR